ncbi:TetR/AcrR family transcriptional regulator [Kitasatospora sp. NA04385]|uniref:TetR/AcrR family transcriptional regulator n=1 Tax=Kitasatospora sp. NA04385 TaxID=2742135 RepID=UPI0015906824|nr:TetR/AcrR family transcriptional regulator [Kitasatospora sp. NA04385]QKW23021.1 TetR/AcrR family transcriptional regulator [Kitasatospora sp. NA04385]
MVTRHPRPPARVGRPRALGPSESELTPREEVLAAAAELFTENGYAATTTRAVAERAGLRQASMYHYFARKEDILATLLESTVEPSLLLATALLARPAVDPAARLWTLAAADAALLHRGLYNLGALYQLPEVRGERFAEFRRSRAELRSAYGELLHLIAPGEPGRELRCDLLLGLVEGGVAVVRGREGDGAPGTEEVGAAVADAALRLAGCDRAAREAAVRAARGLAPA